MSASRSIAKLRVCGAAAVVLVGVLYIGSYFALRIGMLTVSVSPTPTQRIIAALSEPGTLVEGKRANLSLDAPMAHFLYVLYTPIGKADLKLTGSRWRPQYPDPLMGSMGYRF